MAELKLIYDDGYGAKTERTITSFSDPRNDYADCGGDPTWPALLMECWHFLNGLGYVISRQEQDYVDDYLFYGPRTDAEKCSGCCNGNCEHCRCEEPNDEPTDEQFVDSKCAKCAMNDTCKTLDSEDCPMGNDTETEENEKIEDSNDDIKYDVQDFEDMITDILERYEIIKRPPYKVTC